MKLFNRISLFIISGFFAFQNAWAQIDSATGPTLPMTGNDKLGGESPGLYAQIETVIGLFFFMAVFIGLYLFIRNMPASHSKKHRRRR